MLLQNPYSPIPPSFATAACVVQSFLAGVPLIRFARVAGAPKSLEAEGYTIMELPSFDVTAKVRQGRVEETIYFGGSVDEAIRFCSLHRHFVARGIPVPKFRNAAGQDVLFCMLRGDQSYKNALGYTLRPGGSTPFQLYAPDGEAIAGLDDAFSAALYSMAHAWGLEQLRQDMDGEAAT